jgi:hypothetical protein
MDRPASACGPSFEFDCLDAPSLARGDFGWWHAVSGADTAGVWAAPGKTPMCYQGWDRTRAWVINAFATRGPYDGIFGMSQGACLASLVVGMRTAGEPGEGRIDFDFAILIGGFASGDPAHEALYARSAAYRLPSLHVMGRSDGIVPIGRSLQLANRFAEPTIYEHDGGHVIPTEMRFAETFRQFLLERQAEAAAG